METVEQRALRWMASGDTGTSSLTIARHMLGLPQKYVSEPADGGDLGRCLRLLEMIPEWKSRISELSGLSNAWAALVPHWDELAQLMAEETGADFNRYRAAPRTYARIRTITDDARMADGWIVVGTGVSMRATGV